MRFQRVLAILLYQGDIVHGERCYNYLDVSVLEIVIFVLYGKNLDLIIKKVVKVFRTMRQGCMVERATIVRIYGVVYAPVRISITPQGDVVFIVIRVEHNRFYTNI